MLTKMILSCLYTIMIYYSELSENISELVKKILECDDGSILKLYLQRDLLLLEIEEIEEDEKCTESIIDVGGLEETVQSIYDNSHAKTEEKKKMIVSIEQKISEHE